MQQQFVGSALAGGALAKTLLPVAMKGGAKILAKVLRKRGGIAGEVAAEAAITIADEFSVDASPMGIEMAIERNPDGVADALKGFEDGRQETLLTVIQGGFDLVANDQMAEDKYRSRVRPTVIYVFLMVFVWIVGLATFAPPVAALLVEQIASLPAEFWYVIGAAVGSYNIARSVDKGIKNVFGGKI